MPLAFSDVRKSCLNFITDSQVWTGLISNAFSIGIIVSIIILLILDLTYDEEKSTTKNMISFVLYTCVFNTVMYALHDSVLLYNYKLKNENALEKNIISGGFNSNNTNSQFFEGTVAIGPTQVSQSVPEDPRVVSNVNFA